MTDKPNRPTVKVTKPSVERGHPGPVLIYIEGRGGQRIRLYVGGSDDIMMVFLEHDHQVELSTDKVQTVRWPDTP